MTAWEQPSFTISANSRCRSRILAWSGGIYHPILDQVLISADQTNTAARRLQDSLDQVSRSGLALVPVTLITVSREAGSP